VAATNTIKETHRNDERSGRARRRCVAEIPASADGVARLVLIVFGSNIVAVSLLWIGRSLEASFAVVQWVISAHVLILISERETAPMRAEAPAKMPCKLIDCRDPL
jgi:hypothetical protein